MALPDGFIKALEQVCIRQAKSLARDGEGANRLIQAAVEGAATQEDARLAAKAVIGSTLIKTAVYGGDPNWGRIVMALGKSGADVELLKIDMAIGETKVLEKGRPLEFDEEDVINTFKLEEVPIFINLNKGEGSAVAWGCDMSEQYVVINSQYMT